MMCASFHSLKHRIRSPTVNIWVICFSACFRFPRSRHISVCVCSIQTDASHWSIVQSAFVTNHFALIKLHECSASMWMRYGIDHLCDTPRQKTKPKNDLRLHTSISDYLRTRVLKYYTYAHTCTWHTRDRAHSHVSKPSKFSHIFGIFFVLSVCKSHVHYAHSHLSVPMR